MLLPKQYLTTLDIAFVFLSTIKLTAMKNNNCTNNIRQNNTMLFVICSISVVPDAFSIPSSIGAAKKAATTAAAKAASITGRKYSSKYNRNFVHSGLSTVIFGLTLPSTCSKIQDATIGRGRLKATSALSLDARCATIVIASKLSRIMGTKSLHPISGRSNLIFPCGAMAIVRENHFRGYPNASVWRLSKSTAK